MSKKSFTAIIVICCLTLCLLQADTAWAQESLGLAVSPPTFEISANAGDIIVNSVRVQNLTNTSVEVAVDRRNFTALGEEGAVGLTEEEIPFSLASWVSVSPAEEVIPAQGTRVFNFTIDVPPNAEPGGHFGSIVFKTGGIQPGQTGAAVSQELGTLVLLKIAGEIAEKAVVESFVTTRNLWEYGPVEFEARIKNEGNVHLKPTGTVTVTNLWGGEAATLRLEPRNVLPGAIRKLPAVWDKKLLLGRFNATASVTYGSQGEVLTASTTFVVFPYKIGGLIAMVVGVFVVLSYRLRKRLRLVLKVLSGSYE